MNAISRTSSRTSASPRVETSVVRGGRATDSAGTTVARRRGRPPVRGGSRSSELSTRELILTAAATAFAERGYCGVNLADVVEELGFTKGALYFYFPNKETLAAEIVERHFAAWELMLPSAIEETEDLVEALVKVTHSIAEAFRNDPIARAGTRLSSERNIINTPLPEPFVGWINRIADLLRRAQEAGLLVEAVDPKALARLVVSYFFGAQLVSEALTRRDDLHKRIDEFWAIVLPQVRTKAPAARPRPARARTR